MPDLLKKIGNSLIQYGKQNDRIYLMKLAKEDFPWILAYMNDLALKQNFSKIFAKVPESLKLPFIKDGYEQEAIVKGFFGGRENCFFMSKYFSEKRKIALNAAEEDETTRLCVNRSNSAPERKLDKKYCIKQLSKQHIWQITNIYKKVFETYPFEIFDDSYIQKTMGENVDYFGVFDGDKIIAVSSSEMDFENKNCEMTDFAALPECRGNGFSYFLLKEMEKSTRAKGIKTFYTIARSQNAAINMAFAKCGYTFGGKLVNNTNICGKIESMNIWFKSS